MYLEKKINSNAILVKDQMGVEQIVLGKGIAFAVGKDGWVNQSLIEKSFTLDNPEKIMLFREMISKIPLEHIQFTETVIQLIKSELQKEISPNIYITLTDHISFTIRRSANNQLVKNILLSEIKTFYTEEFQVSMQIVKKMNHEFNLTLAEDEAGFIAMHIVNAELGENDSNQSIKIMTIVKKIMSLILAETQLDLDESSLDYSRLLVHIKFFSQRIVYQKQWDDKKSDDLFHHNFKESKAYKLTKKIVKVINETYDIDISNEEINYLTIHINRLLHRKIDS